MLHFTGSSMTVYLFFMAPLVLLSRIYSVETENIDKVVALYGPATKLNAIVGGQV
jgi:hypothetical protein